MNTTQQVTKLGTVTVKGRVRMAFRRDGQVWYFPSITKKAQPANVDDAATWED